MKMIELKRGKNTLGKSVKASILVKDKSVSNIHVNIEVNDEATKAYLM